MTIGRETAMKNVKPYEYAGFKFLVSDNGQGDVFLTAEPGQHPAAYKEKHLRNARECYLKDHGGAGMGLTLAERNSLP